MTKLLVSRTAGMDSDTSVIYEVTALLVPLCSHAGGPFGIDSELPLDTNGIWARKYQTALENGVVAVEVAGAPARCFGETTAWVTRLRFWSQV